MFASGCTRAGPFAARSVYRGALSCLQRSDLCSLAADFWLGERWVETLQAARFASDRGHLYQLAVALRAKSRQLMLALAPRYNSVLGAGHLKN